MLLVDDPHTVVIQGQFEHGDSVIVESVNRYRSADEVRKALLTEGDVLFSLNDTVLVLSYFRLHGNDKLAALTIDADIKLIDLNLPDVFDRGPQMVLKGMCRYSEKRSIKRL